MKTVYLAGAWHDRERLRLMRSLICAAGFGVRASWLDTADDLPSYEADHDAFYREQAEACLSEIDRSDGLVVFESDRVSQGASVETGYALANDKPVFLVGHPRSVFHTMAIECEGITGLIVGLHQHFFPTLIDLPGGAWDGRRYLIGAEQYKKLRETHSEGCSAWRIGATCDCVAAVRPFDK